MINFKERLNRIQTVIERENSRLVDKQLASHDESTGLLLNRLFDVRANLSYFYTRKPYLKSAMDELRTKEI